MSDFRKALFLSLVAGCLVLGWSLAAAGQANIFVYHRFGDDRYPSTNVSLEDFEKHLTVLKSEGARVLPLGEVVDYLQEGKDLPQPCVVLTVDDAYRSFLRGGMPLLRRFGYTATLFVNTDAVGRPGYLNWEELKSLEQEGIEIGNHSASHMHLVDRSEQETADAWLGRVKKDVLAAQQALKANLGHSPRLFSYPYGEYSPEIMEVIRSMGFAGAVAQQSGVAGEAASLFALPRFPMGGAYTDVKGFTAKLKMKPLPVRVISPEGPVLGEENPPLLRVSIDAEIVDLRRLRCYVPGQENAVITPAPDEAGVYAVQAVAPIGARRSKYTLTAPAKNGGSWYWFSQLWIRPEIAE